ncbi:hypothetical protein BDP55DRAFT_632121 [Colletotrichum godetiae]|uniref:Uncharacterized protein n=1 Tax=Colletotrichum godetiae TaxID=1209918 RepID=A0AAJ0AN67_9PEZI|nr:uncharacterized protein BDP55DRAFT_632121 [Colletotrichum godetiae]KAK1675437.1 hypothetical protein BDP55DRAFT_632121 [Colletotrichum godetiae]
MYPPPDFGRYRRAIRVEKWVDWAKSQKLPAFINYPDKAARIDMLLHKVYWDFDITDLPDVRNQECWKHITSILRNPGPHPTEMIYIHALNAVDCELARIFNNGRMHETLVEMARNVGFDAYKCCDPSLSTEQRKIEPPRGPRQMNSADEHTIEDRAAITSRRFDLDKLNYAAVSELLLEQQALKEKREAAAAARTAPNSAVGRYQGGSAGNGGGWHQHASPASSGCPRNEPKASKKTTAVDGNVRFRLQSNKPSSLTKESTVSRRMSSSRGSRGPIADLFDQAEPSILNDPRSTLVIDGVIVQQGQAGGGVQQERAIATATARPPSRSATSTPSRGLSSFHNPFTKPPAQPPVNPQPTTEQQARRESSGTPRGIPLQHRTLARRPSGTQGSEMSTPSTPPTQASSSSVRQQSSSAVKTQVQEQKLAAIPPAEHKTDSQTAVISTQESSTQAQNLTAEIAKKLEATINQSLLEAIRGVYRGVPKIMEAKIRGWLDSPECRSVRFTVLRDVESETTKIVKGSVMAKMKAMEQIIKGSENPRQAESVRDTKRNADEKDAEEGDQTQQAVKRQRGDGGGSA